MREVYIAGVGLTKVDLTGKVFGNVFDLFQDAYRRALEMSEVRDFDAIQVGIMDSEEFENRANIAAKIADRLGLAGVPTVRTETASSTGAAAFHEACFKIRSGAADTVLVIAGERMKNVTTKEATQIMSKTVDPVERRFGCTMPALMALISQAFLARIGVSGADVAHVLSRLMHRAHALGADNPLAAFSGRPEALENYFDETRNLWVASPLRRKDCSPICDGAAAIILTSRPEAVRIAGLGAATDTSSLLDRVHLDRLEATRKAAAFAYREAGIRDIGDVEGLVCEVHDAFNSLLLLNLVDLGLVPEEKVVEAAIGPARGDAPAMDPYELSWTGPRGRLPTNLSGGLKSRGHPVGGTGCFQIAELYLQLTGAFPNPAAQVRNARLGLAHSIGGPGNNIFVTLLERADNRRDVALKLPAPERLLAGLERIDASTLHGKRATIDAATTIHVTALGDGPIHVALLSFGGKRVFAKLDAPAEAGADALATLAAHAGKSARLLTKDDGDHYFQVEPDRRDVGAIVRLLIDRVWRREPA